MQYIMAFDQEPQAPVVFCLIMKVKFAVWRKRIFNRVIRKRVG